MIPVTKPYLPSRERLDRYIDGIYERGWLTNNGPLVQELTQRLEEYLGVDNLLLVNNGTIALQVAYRALGISGQAEPAEAITTPFTFVATASSLKWDGVQPVFVDIDADTWCLDPALIEAAITPRTRAIVPVHVFGNACDVEAIDEVGHRHGLKVVYDAAHAFGVTYKGESLLKHGDAATLSFHATKLFHSVEGGAIVFKHKADLERAKKMINFGITGPESIEELGINAKMNEFQAAMGLCVLDEMEDNLKARKEVWQRYEDALPTTLQLQAKHPALGYNYAYFPVVFESEEQAVRIAAALKESGVQARRYFYPSLNLVECFEAKTNQPVSTDIASRILCLPLYATLDPDAVIHELSEVTEQVKIEDAEKLPDEVLINFLEEMDAHFEPPMRERVNLRDYITKLKEHGNILGVLNSEKNLVAVIAFYANDKDTRTAYVTYLAVHPDAWGQSLGKLLVAKALTQAATQGMNACKVKTWNNNRKAIKLYQSAGFKIIDQRQSDDSKNVYLEAVL